MLEQGMHAAPVLHFVTEHSNDETLEDDAAQ